MWGLLKGSLIDICCCFSFEASSAEFSGWLLLSLFSGIEFHQSLPRPSNFRCFLFFFLIYFESPILGRCWKLVSLLHGLLIILIAIESLLISNHFPPGKKTKKNAKLMSSRAGVASGLLQQLLGRFKAARRLQLVCHGNLVAWQISSGSLSWRGGSKVKWQRYLSGMFFCFYIGFLVVLILDNGFKWCFFFTFLEWFVSALKANKYLLGDEKVTSTLKTYTGCSLGYWCGVTASLCLLGCMKLCLAQVWRALRLGLERFQSLGGAETWSSCAFGRSRISWVLAVQNLSFFGWTTILL